MHWNAKCSRKTLFACLQDPVPHRNELWEKQACSPALFCWGWFVVCFCLTAKAERWWRIGAYKAFITKEKLKKPYGIREPTGSWRTSFEHLMPASAVKNYKSYYLNFIGICWPLRISPSLRLLVTLGICKTNPRARGAPSTLRRGGS